MPVLFLYCEHLRHKPQRYFAIKELFILPSLFSLHTNAKELLGEMSVATLRKLSEMAG